MRRECHVIWGLVLPWQVVQAAVYLADGRRAGVRMDLPRLPASTMVPPDVKRRLWRQCARTMRLQESAA